MGECNYSKGDLAGFLAGADEELRRYSSALALEFRQAAAATQSQLTPAEVASWAREGLGIARHSFRSWEAALEYFRASPAVAPLLGFSALMDWALIGRDLANYSASIASSFFRSSPETLCFVAPAEIPAWARLGSRLYKETWKSGLLCGHFFAASPRLMGCLSFDDLSRLVDLLEDLARFSFDAAVDCLGAAETAFSSMNGRDRSGFLDLAFVITERNWRAAKSYFAGGPRALAAIDPVNRRLFFAVARELAQSSRDEALAFFFEVPPCLAAMDRILQAELLALARGVLKLSSAAGMAFLGNCPDLVKRLALDELKEWVDIGLGLLAERSDAGIAFFQLTSNRSTLAIRQVARGVELSEVCDTLRLYSEGLTGKNISMLSSKDLVAKGIGWISAEMPATEGAAIFLPPYMDEFEDKRQNSESYKVLVTHQASHLEFGTFGFSFQRPSTFFDDRRPEIHAALAGKDDAITDFERFFDLFTDRRLAGDAFAILEDARIDARVRWEYPGIRRGYELVQRNAHSKRSIIASLPLRQGILEFLVQASLTGSLSFAVPSPFYGSFAAAATLLKQLRSPLASVEDTAEATIRLYTILRRVPNLVFRGDALAEVELDRLAGEVSPFDTSDFVAANDPSSTLEYGEPYASPDSVDYRGEVKPELVQTMIKLRQNDGRTGQEGGFPISLDQLKELLAKSMDIEVIDEMEGNIDSSGLFITNLMREHGRMQAAKSKKNSRKKSPDAGVEEDEDIGEDIAGVSFFYDEWDFRAGDYRPQWCRLKEVQLAEGTTAFFDVTLRAHAGLAIEVKRQFEMLRPELFKKLKRLQDGEEYDLDQVIESVVEKKAGQSPSDKVYWRKNKLDRDIAVALLLDMSASTDEEIKDPESSAVDWWDEDWTVLHRFGRTIAPPVRVPGKRIIDVEKESIVLLIKALETIGDKYGIYGFSGYGRDNVEFFVVKDMNEEFGDKTKRRIDKISPIRGTRMGPAIRHCISKLERQPAKVRLLILLSDGRPQDHDYGKDRTEKEYAIHDTRMALLEAKRKNIVPFCLTVDKAGSDYLRSMMGDMGYEVVKDIESLPKRLTSLYKRLTT